MCAVMWPFMPVFLSGSALCATFGVTRHASACANDTGARHEAITRATVPTFGNPKTRWIMTFSCSADGPRQRPGADAAAPAATPVHPRVGFYSTTNTGCEAE